jgi:hypothetical protein
MWLDIFLAVDIKILSFRLWYHVVW